MRQKGDVVKELYRQTKILDITVQNLVDGGDPAPGICTPLACIMNG
jgi:hypothetical protein